MTTDEAIAAAKARGLRVYNVGELAAGGWVANLIDGERVSETGNGSTPALAIADAIAQLVPSATPAASADEDPMGLFG